jgi:hypothetical protein
MEANHLQVMVVFPSIPPPVDTPPIDPTNPTDPDPTPDEDGKKEEKQEDRKAQLFGLVLDRFFPYLTLAADPHLTPRVYRVDSGTPPVHVFRLGRNLEAASPRALSRRVKWIAGDD